MVILFVLALLVGGGTLGYFWYQKTRMPAEKSSSSGGSIAIDLSNPDDNKTETLQTALVIPKSTDQVGDTIKLSSLTITVPEAWRTINGKNLLNTPLTSIYAVTANDILTQLIMVPDTNPTDKTLAMNNLSMYNITGWLGQPTQGSNGFVTPEMKQAYIANISNLGNGQPTNPDACTGGDGVFYMELCSGLLKPTVVSTADGSLKGIAFLSTKLTTDPGYDPQVIVFMTGQTKDQQLLLYGAFHLLDNNSHTLSTTDTDKLKATWESFIGGNVPSDTVALYNRVLTALKSITLQIN